MLSKKIKRLADGEFTILKAVWYLPQPTTSAQIMAYLGEDNHWKPQTLLTVLARLTEKGYLSSERVGRERHYTALVSEEDYLEVEASDFLNRYKGHSLSGFINNLFQSNSLSDDDMNELRQLLNQVPK